MSKYMNKIIRRIILQQVINPPAANILSKQKIIETIKNVVDLFKLQSIQKSFITDFVQYIYIKNLTFNVLKQKSDQTGQILQLSANKLLNQSIFIKYYNNIIYQQDDNAATEIIQKDKTPAEKVAERANSTANRNPQEKQQNQQIIRLIVNKDKTFYFIDDDSGDRIQSKESINILDKYVTKNIEKIKLAARQNQQYGKTISSTAITKAKEYIKHIPSCKNMIQYISTDKLRKELRRTQIKEYMKINVINDKFTTYEKIQYYSIIACIILYIAINAKNNTLTQIQHDLATGKRQAEATSKQKEELQKNKEKFIEFIRQYHLVNNINTEIFDLYFYAVALHAKNTQPNLKDSNTIVNPKYFTKLFENFMKIARENNYFDRRYTKAGHRNTMFDLHTYTMNKYYECGAIIANKLQKAITWKILFRIICTEIFNKVNENTKKQYQHLLQQNSFIVVRSFYQIGAESNMCAQFNADYAKERQQEDANTRAETQRKAKEKEDEKIKEHAEKLLDKAKKAMASAINEVNTDKFCKEIDTSGYRKSDDGQILTDYTFYFLKSGKKAFTLDRSDDLKHVEVDGQYAYLDEKDQYNDFKDWWRKFPKKYGADLRAKQFKEFFKACRYGTGSFRNLCKSYANNFAEAEEVQQEYIDYKKEHKDVLG